MLVRNQCNLGEFKYELPAIARAGNEQLRLETILAALQNNVLETIWESVQTPKWLATVSFDALQKAGTTCPRDGLSAIRMVEASRCSRILTADDEENARLLGRLENLRDLLVICSEAIEMFEIGSDYGMFGAALGARVRECNLDLPSLNLPSLRKLTITMRFDHTREKWIERIEPHVTDWKTRIEDGCKKVAGWLREEYSARGLRVTVDIQTDLDPWF